MARRLLTTLFPFVLVATEVWETVIQLMSGYRNLDQEKRGSRGTLLAHQDGETVVVRILLLDGPFRMSLQKLYNSRTKSLANLLLWVA